MKLTEEQAHAHPITDFLTVQKYVDFLIDKTNRQTITRQTVIHYLIETDETADSKTMEKADQLDWFIWSGVTMILFNEKAKKFTPGNNYGKGGPPRKSLMSF